MCKLQCIQNVLARIVINFKKYSRAPHFLEQLHWIQVKFRCIFKTATSVHKFLHSAHPTYFGFCPLVVDDIVQDTTIQMKGSWRFFSSIYLYINPETLWPQLCF